MQIIKNRQIVEDQWLHVADDADVNQLPAGDIIAPFALWQAHSEQLLQRQGQLGIRLNGDNDVAEIAADLPHFSVIALQFPAFRDGRAYSIARALRQHYGYTGELRAVGNVLRDQVSYMSRVGFDAFEIDPKQKIEDALNAFSEISVKYQSSSDEPLPIYRRRA
jgi:uncharacterized protein (DUF934 family)